MAAHPSPHRGCKFDGEAGPGNTETMTPLVPSPRHRDASDIIAVVTVAWIRWAPLRNTASSRNVCLGVLQPELLCTGSARMPVCVSATAASESGFTVYQILTDASQHKILPMSFCLLR